jgi:CRISPR-associated protein Cmr2
VSDAVNCYTAITFAPVQGFIEKSRKLRDLYGSSYLLSLLSQSVCVGAEKQGYTVVSPALPNIIQGMPNQIILRGEVAKTDVEQWFYATWAAITDTCRQWVMDEVKGDWTYTWNRDWSLWTKHTWEFFHVIGQPGESITQVRQRLNERKRSRSWTGINWQGESSTLSGTDAVAWAELGKIATPSAQVAPWRKGTDNKSPIERFYEELSRKLGESFMRETPELHRQYRHDPQRFLDKSIEYGAAFIDPDEELNIPELTKRLITHKAVVKNLIQRMGALSYLTDLQQQLEQDLNPERFTDLNRLQHKRTNEPQYWTGWFQGDGDGASDYSGFQLS